MSRLTVVVFSNIQLRFVPLRDGSLERFSELGQEGRGTKSVSCSVFLYPGVWIERRSEGQISSFSNLQENFFCSALICWILEFFTDTKKRINNQKNAPSNQMNLVARSDKKKKIMKCSFWHLEMFIQHIMAINQTLPLKVLKMTDIVSRKMLLLAKIWTLAVFTEREYEILRRIIYKIFLDL